MSEAVQVELERVANAIAEGSTSPLAGVSQETHAALLRAELAMTRIRNGKHPLRHVALRVVVARALVVDGMRLETPARKLRRLGPCQVCGVGGGERCVTAEGQPAHRSHKGRS